MAQLAQAVGRCEASIRHWEADFTQPSLAALLRLCLALQCEPDQFFRPVEAQRRLRRPEGVAS